MKKYIFIIALLNLVILFSCQKYESSEADTNKGIVTFWTTENPGWVLWVDRVEIGEIKNPYPINTLDQIPVCGDIRFTSITLRRGKHSYYMVRSIPAQPPPNYFVSRTIEFNVTGGDCVIVRCTQ